MFGKRILPLFLLLALAIMARTARAQVADTIHADITGLHSDKGHVLCAICSTPADSDKGHVLCAICSTPADFPRQAEKAVTRTSVVISGRHAVCEFTGIRPGRYGISVIHDENDNGKMDTKIFGIPREGVGASNDARGRFGPPKFEDAAFQFGGGRLDLKITVAYL